MPLDVKISSPLVSAPDGTRSMLLLASAVPVCEAEGLMVPDSPIPAALLLSATRSLLVRELEGREVSDESAGLALLVERLGRLVCTLASPPLLLLGVSVSGAREVATFVCSTEPSLVVLCSDGLVCDSREAEVADNSRALSVALLGSMLALCEVCKVEEMAEISASELFGVGMSVWDVRVAERLSLELLVPAEDVGGLDSNESDGGCRTLPEEVLDPASLVCDPEEVAELGCPGASPVLVLLGVGETGVGKTGVGEMREIATSLMLLVWEPKAPE